MSTAFVIDGASLWDPKSPDLSALLKEAARIEPTAPICVDSATRHRLAAGERPAFERAVTDGRIVTPPAGTIGGTNAFLRHLASMPNVSVICSPERAVVVGGPVRVLATA